MKKNEQYPGAAWNISSVGDNESRQLCQVSGKC